MFSTSSGKADLRLSHRYIAGMDGNAPLKGITFTLDGKTYSLPLSDGPNMWPLARMEGLLKVLLELDGVVKRKR